MNTKEIIKSQYLAALEMLKHAVEDCPESLWDDKIYKNRFWHIAYHALYFTHLYLQEDLQKFVPWYKHREHYQFLGKKPWPPFEESMIGNPFSKEEVLEYLAFCKDEVELKVNLTDFSAESGFHWLSFNKLELQLYNIRHTQHHIGQLFEKLRAVSDSELRWIGTTQRK